MPHAVILMRSGTGRSAGVLLKSQCPLCGLQSRGPRETSAITQKNSIVSLRPLHSSKSHWWYSHYHQHSLISVKQTGHRVLTEKEKLRIKNNQHHLSLIMSHLSNMQWLIFKTEKGCCVTAAWWLKWIIERELGTAEREKEVKKGSEQVEQMDVWQGATRRCVAVSAGGPRYLQVAPVQAHSVDLSTTRPGWVHPVDEFFLVIKIQMDDVVEALRITQRQEMLRFSLPRTANDTGRGETSAWNARFLQHLCAMWFWLWYRFGCSHRFQYFQPHKALDKWVETTLPSIKTEDGSALLLCHAHRTPLSVTQSCSPNNAPTPLSHTVGAEKRCQTIWQEKRDIFIRPSTPSQTGAKASWGDLSHSKHQL